MGLFVSNLRPSLPAMLKRNGPSGVTLRASWEGLFVPRRDSTLSYQGRAGLVPAFMWSLRLPARGPMIRPNRRFFLARAVPKLDIVTVNKAFRLR